MESLSLGLIGYNICIYLFTFSQKKNKSKNTGRFSFSTITFYALVFSRILFFSILLASCSTDSHYQSHIGIHYTYPFILVFKQQKSSALYAFRCWCWNEQKKTPHKAYLYTEERLHFIWFHRQMPPSLFSFNVFVQFALPINMTFL